MTHPQQDANVAKILSTRVEPAFLVCAFSRQKTCSTPNNVFRKRTALSLSAPRARQARFCARSAQCLDGANRVPSPISASFYQSQMEEMLRSQLSGRCNASRENASRTPARATSPGRVEEVHRVGPEPPPTTRRFRERRSIPRFRTFTPSGRSDRSLAAGLRSPNARGPSTAIRARRRRIVPRQRDS